MAGGIAVADQLQTKNREPMTTQALSQTISLRHQLTLNDLLKIAPQLSAVLTQPMPSMTIGGSRAAKRVNDASYNFWTTFAFGSIQAVILFGLIYAYFSH